MNVDVLSRRKVSAMEPRDDTCLVSIWSLVALATGFYEEAPINFEGWKDTIRLDFDDVTLRDNVPILNPLMRVDDDHSFVTVPFDSTHARPLLDFIERHKGSPFIVHCDAGISRSVAVGTFMAAFHGYDVKFHQTNSDEYRNIHVFNVLRRTAFGEDVGLVPA